MKKWIGVTSILLTLVALLIAGLLVLCFVLAPYTQTIVADCLPNVNTKDAIFAGAHPCPTILLDPGHGGEDSGAVGVGGVLEKELNLALSLRLRDLLRFEGWQVILTREEDRLLYRSDVALSHKTQDLKTRLDYSVRYPDAIFVSIHMNKFPAEYCRGFQIYYSPNHPASQGLAELLQTEVREKLDAENHRESKSATSSIYILHRIRIPAILIECGFLSNREESAWLQREDYQKKMVAILAAGLYEAWERGLTDTQDTPSADGN